MVDIEADVIVKERKLFLNSLVVMHTIRGLVCELTLGVWVLYTGLWFIIM